MLSNNNYIAPKGIIAQFEAKDDDVSAADDELEAIKQKKMAELQKAAAERQAMSAITQPIHLTDSNFTSETAKYPLMLIDFWAPWCGPCRMVAPIIDQLAKEYAGKVIFGKVNVDENPVISNTFGIASIPTMMMFKGGKVIDVIIGAMPKGQIEMKLKQHLSGGSTTIYS
jgi:thioredoxin 1